MTNANIVFVLTGGVFLPDILWHLHVTYMLGSQHTFQFFQFLINAILYSVLSVLDQLVYEVSWSIEEAL